VHAELAKSKYIRRFASPLHKAAALLRELKVYGEEQISAMGNKPNLQP